MLRQEPTAEGTVVVLGIEWQGVAHEECDQETAPNMDNPPIYNIYIYNQL